jgi:uncharacterized membrane protein YdjX (TVP38/TMEM64 family)
MGFTRKEKIIRALLLLVSIGLTVFLLWYINHINPHFYKIIFKLSSKGDIAGLAAYLSHFGYKAAIITVILLVICNVSGLPTIPFLTVAGVIFGLIPGIIISWVGEVIGCLISFILTRFFFRSHAEKLIGKYHMLTRLDSYSTLKSMMAARAIPYSPNILFTAIGAISSLSFRDHFWATVIGKWPSVIIEVWFGHDLLRVTEHFLRFAILLAGLIVFYVYMKQKKKDRGEE